MVVLHLRRRAMLLAALLMFIGGILLARTDHAAVFSPEETAQVVVIDAGHGGVDGGAVARDGTVESGINLAVALRLRELFRFCGTEPLMTREADVSIHSGDAVTIRQQKVSDLKNRVALVNAQQGATLISIHQNSLPEAPSVRGAQVFFNPVAGAAELAASTQAQLNAAVNGGRDKAAKPIPSSIYLMQQVSAPAILVECGFLSNEEETALLNTPSHQTRLALAILCGYYQREEVPS